MTKQPRCYSSPSIHYIMDILRKYDKIRPLPYGESITLYANDSTIDTHDKSPYLGHITVDDDTICLRSGWLGHQRIGDMIVINLADPSIQATLADLCEEMIRNRRWAARTRMD